MPGEDEGEYNDEEDGPYEDETDGDMNLGRMIMAEKIMMVKTPMVT